MEKAIVFEQPKQKTTMGSHPVVLFGLVTCVVALAVALVTLSLSGSWYVRHLTDTCGKETDVTATPETSEEFDLKVDDNGEVYEHIVTFAEKQLEFITVRSRESGLISFLAIMDKKLDAVNIYSSVENECYVTDAGEFDFRADLQYYRSHDNFDDVERTLDYAVGARVQSLDDVSGWMTPYCTLSNTYELVQVQPGSRVKRGGSVSILWGLIKVTWD